MKTLDDVFFFRFFCPSMFSSSASPSFPFTWWAPRLRPLTHRRRRRNDSFAKKERVQEKRFAKRTGHDKKNEQRKKKKKWEELLSACVDAGTNEAWMARAMDFGGGARIACCGRTSSWRWA